jgi:DNA-binding phage protein
MDLADSESANKFNVRLIELTQTDRSWNLTRLGQGKTSRLDYRDNYESMQLDLESAVEEVNNFIVEINKTNQMATPLTHTVLFKQKHGKRFTLYGNLSDGCHPNESTILKIIKSFNRAITLNQDKH